MQDRSAMNCEEVQKVGTALTILNPVENHHAAHLVLVPQSNIHLRDPRVQQEER